MQVQTGELLLRERAVRLVFDTMHEYGSEFAAITSIATKLKIGSAETLRKWVRQAEVDGGSRPGCTSEELAEIEELEREVAELRRASEIVTTASTFFAAELDRPYR